MLQNNLMNSLGVVELGDSFQSVGAVVAAFLPKLIIALLILAIGWTIGAILGRFVAQVVKTLKFDKVLQAAGIEDVMEHAGFRLDPAAFIGALVKWFIIVVFLVVFFDILNLNEVNDFLKGYVLTFLPKVIVAVLILLVGAVVADATQKVVVGSSKAAGVKSPHLFGGLAKWMIWVFAFIIALAQLDIAGRFMEILFQGIVYMFVIAGGLAFGLGGKEEAARFLAKLRKDISHHED